MGEPRIELRAPSIMLRGTSYDVEVVITLDTPLEIAGIELQLRGVDGWRLVIGGAGCDRTHIEIVRQMVGPSMLQAEVHRFPFRISIPSSMAPTHSFAPAYSKAELQVTLEIPRFWRPNIRTRFALAFREAPPGTISRVPARVRSAGKEAIELGLGATQLVAGEQLLGTCAVFGVEDPRAVTLSLQPDLSLIGDRGLVEKQIGRSYDLEIPVGAPGRASPFMFRVPADAMPSFRADTHVLAWRFAARLGGITTSLPVEIVDASAASRAAPMVDIPAIVESGTGPYR